MPLPTPTTNKTVKLLLPVITTLASLMRIAGVCRLTIRSTKKGTFKFTLETRE